MELFSKVMLFLIFMILIFTLLNIYIRTYYNRNEYFSNDKPCSILNTNNTGSITDNTSGITDNYYVINNSKEHLKMDSNYNLSLCKCVKSNTPWQMEYKDNRDKYKDEISLSYEDFCFLGKIFESCSCHIFSSENNKNYYLCSRKNKLVIKTYDQFTDFNKQVETKYKNKPNKIKKESYNNIFYMIDIRYILENLPNNSNIMKQFNINYTSTEQKIYIITNNPNDLLGLLYPDYNIKKKDRNSSFYIGSKNNNILFYRNNNNILFKNNTVDFYNYNSLKNILWSFNLSDTESPIVVSLHNWNREWEFTDNGEIQTLLKINLTMKNGIYGGSVIYKEYVDDVDNTTNCYLYTIYSYDIDSKTIYAKYNDIVTKDEDNASTSDCRISSDEGIINVPIEDLEKNVLVITMKSCSQEETTEDIQEDRIKAWLIDKDKILTSLCGGDNIDICSVNENNYCNAVI